MKENKVAFNLFKKKEESKKVADTVSEKKSSEVNNSAQKPSALSSVLKAFFVPGALLYSTYKAASKAVQSLLPKKKEKANTASKAANTNANAVASAVVASNVAVEKAKSPEKVSAVNSEVSSKVSPVKAIFEAGSTSHVDAAVKTSPARTV